MINYCVYDDHMKNYSMVTNYVVEAIKRVWKFATTILYTISIINPVKATSMLFYFCFPEKLVSSS